MAWTESQLVSLQPPDKKEVGDIGQKAVSLTDDERPIILKVENLEKTYDPGKETETKALRGVNMEISLGEIVIIFGSSGSGKSTMLNILAGLDTPTGGKVNIDNKDLTKMTAKERVQYHQFKVGMVFQAYNLIENFTVLQNISMPARLAGFKPREYKARAYDLLKQFQLEHTANHLSSRISGGQQQRVGIMRAFMNRPAFIIADEPTGNLDSVNSKYIMSLFKQLNTDTNTTMIIVTHDASLFAIADRVVHVQDGKITKQTLLTPKAKVDMARIDVPVEINYRDEKASLVSVKEAPGVAKTKPESATAALHSVISEMLAHRQDLAPATQRILLALMTILTTRQENMLNREELDRMVSGIEAHLKGELDYSGLQAFLDRPWAEGGVGLYRQTAEHIATGIETMLRLGSLQVRKKKR